MNKREKYIFSLILVLFILITSYFSLISVIIPVLTPDPTINSFPLECPKPTNCTRVADTQVRGEGLSVPIINSSIIDVKNSIVEYLNSQDTEILYDTDSFIHVKFWTPLWRFMDDVSIKLFCNEDNQTVVWIQSQSRIGEGDFGTNERRVANLLTYIDNYEFIESQCLI